MTHKAEMGKKECRKISSKCRNTKQIVSNPVVIATGFFGCSIHERVIFLSPMNEGDFPCSG
jgi:hypothetical protein